MRNRLLTIAFLLWASSLAAEQFSVFGLSPGDPFACNGATEGAIYQNTTSHLLFGCNGTSWTGAGLPSVFDFRSTEDTSGSAGFGWFNMNATFSSANYSVGSWLQFHLFPNATGAQQPIYISMDGSSPNAIYTAPISSYQSTALSNGTSYGVYTQVTGTSLENIGVQALTFSGTADTVGVWGAANSGAGTVIGGEFRVAGAATTKAGIWATYNTVAAGLPTVSGAGVFDNYSTTNPMIVATDNGLKRWSIEDNAALWAANTKTLTESSATAFARLTIASGSSGGANIDYCIEANDSTDFQSRCGMLPVAAVNKAGTITCTVGTVDAASEVVAVSSGTLTNTFTCADSGTNFLDIKADATSSLTQTTLRINYFVRQQGNAAVAFTPQ